MINIEFEYNKKITIIEAKVEDKFKDVINKYLQKSLLDSKFLSFLVHGKEKNQEETIEKILEEKDKIYKYLKVIVQDFVQSKDIICPQCHEPCRIKINNFKIELSGCKNKHNSNDIKVKDFPDTQKVNNSKIECSECHNKNKGSSPYEEFFICKDCSYKIICSSCKPKHEQNHKIINYDQRDFICEDHNNPFIKCCTHCNKNICSSCEEEEHTKHKKVDNDNKNKDKNKDKNNEKINENNYIKDNIKDIEKLMKEEKFRLYEKKNEIEIFNINIKYIIGKLNKIIDIMNVYYEIINNLLNVYETKNQNYRVLQNIKEMNAVNNPINRDLNEINRLNNINEKFNRIVQFYNSISSELIENVNESNKLNQISIRYKIVPGDTEIKLFGKNFVENNKNNCHLLIDGDPNKLFQYYKLSNEQKNKDHIEIKLIETKPITNVSNIFDGCNSLQSITDWNTSNIEDMSYMFCNCYKLESLPDISRWNTENVVNMSSMFLNCSSLKSFPEISEWKINKVKNMSYMFAGCKSLISFPIITKWLKNENIEKKEIFRDCKDFQIPGKTEK